MTKGASGCSLFNELPATDGQDREIKCAAAKIKNQDGFGIITLDCKKRRIAGQEISSL